MDKTSHPHCSFCGKNKEEVRLIQSGEIFICNECVDLCNEIFKQKSEGLVKITRGVTDLGYLDEKRLAEYLSEQYNVPAIDLSKVRLTPKLKRIIPKNIAERYMVVPVEKKDETLVIAMSNPTDAEAIDKIRKLTKLEIQIVVATEESLKKVIDRY